MTENEKTFFRIDGDLAIVDSMPEITHSELLKFIFNTVCVDYGNKDGDFSFSFSDRRWRGNFYKSNGRKQTLAFRMLPMSVPDIDTLELPESFKRVVNMLHGLVLVTGPTGSGKSTTIAAMIKLILQKRAVHLITIENPVEYLFESTNYSLVHQREVAVDTDNLTGALKYALRQNPDVIFIGEVRDPESAALAVNAAETGHLVFATMHTINVQETINRLCGLFPPEARHLVTQQMAGALNLVVSQRLVKKIGGGRRAAIEALFPDEAIRDMIREGKTHLMSTHYEKCDYINIL